MYNIYEIIILSFIMFFRIFLIGATLLLIQLVVYQGSGKKINLYKSINKFVDKLLQY